MLTKDFIGMIAQAAGLSKKDTEQLLATTNAVMRENLMAGKVIQWQGLGAFEIKERAARTNGVRFRVSSSWFSVL